MSTVAHTPRYNHETPEEAGSHATPTVGHHMGLEPRQPMDPRGWGRPQAVVRGLGASPPPGSFFAAWAGTGLGAQRPVSREGVHGQGECVCGGEARIFSPVIGSLRP